MEANELRVGNFISLYRSPQDKEMSIGKIRSIYYSPMVYESYVAELHDGFVVNVEKGINPTPLTEEWLLKLGFKEISFTEDRNRDWYKMFEIDNTSEIISLNYYTKTNYCRFNFDIGYGNKYLDLYYVHQLQNLYIVLTGEELSLKTKIEP